MKRFVFLIFAIFAVFIVGCSQAEDSTQSKESSLDKTSEMEQGSSMMEKENSQMEEKNSTNSMGTGYEMKNGQMVVIDSKNHEEMPMKTDAMLADGTKIMPDGKVIKPNGEIFMLKEHESMWQDGTFMTGEEHTESNSMNYEGKVLAGVKSKYLEFNNEDYQNALKENKKILLYFYASWCPTCRAEQPQVHAAFNEFSDESLVGFRVNYKDSDTDSYEAELAKQFGIAYQHTKVVLVDGERVLKAPDSWDKQRYIDEISKFS